jgi:hypothetical protein
VMQRVVELQQRTEDLNGRVAQLEQQLPSQARPKPQGPTK